MDSHPYFRFLHTVSQPLRYVGGEFGSVQKQMPLNGRIVLVFPDVYEVGMSHLGTRILLNRVNQERDLAAERCFAPWDDMERELLARNLPLLSLETATPLNLFDIVGFSLQHELSYTNVLLVLHLSRIPLLAAERLDQDPIVLGGGPCALHPEPVAPFFDAFFLGEAEEDLPDLIRLVGQMRQKGAPRHEVLRALAERRGIYCPSYPRDRVRKVYVNRLDGPTCDGPVPWNRAVFDRVSAELARGCSEGCRFCEAGFTYRPLRDRSPAQVLGETIEAVRRYGYEEVSLGALSPADYPALAPLVHALAKTLTPEGISLSVSSLRAYGLDNRVLDDLASVRASGLTLAPEAGSQRLRDFINKNVTEEDILEAAARAFAGGFQKLKLYFMIGLPTEGDEDAAAIVELVRKINAVGRASGHRAEVTASTGVFVPRPHTPFQWEGMARPEVVALRQQIIKEGLRRTGVKIKFGDTRVSRLECIFARGDRRLARVILRAFQAGCRFDGWADRLRLDLWDAAFEAEGIDPDAYTRPIPTDAALPWAMVDTLVTREYLLRERELAYAGQARAPCEKPKGGRPTPEQFLLEKPVVCYNCGVGCDPRGVALARSQVVREGNILKVREQTKRRPTLWHLVFTKTGRAAFLSQKDLIKHLPRILRRAGLVLEVSKGFHPMPKISYRQPLPVGYRGVAEWADAFVLLGPGETVDIDALNRASVDGMRFWSATQVESQTRSDDSWRLAFLSPVPDEALRKIVPSLDPRVLKDEMARQELGQDPLRPYPCVITWPLAGHPLGRPHEVLSKALSIELIPWDMVRLM